MSPKKHPAKPPGLNITGKKPQHLPNTKVNKGMARLWIEEHNEDNRPLGAKHVAGYRDEMNAGNWKEHTPVYISFDVSGRLIDGQHRLAAFLRSNLDTIKFNIAVNQPLGTERYIDINKSRTMRDRTGLPVQAIGILGFFIRMNIGKKHEGISRNSSITVTEIERLNDRIGKYVQEIYKVRSKHAIRRINTSPLKAAFIPILQANMGEEWIEQFYQGDHGKGSPAGTLRNWLLEYGSDNSYYPYGCYLAAKEAATAYIAGEPLYEIVTPGKWHREKARAKLKQVPRRKTA